MFQSLRNAFKLFSIVKSKLLNCHLTNSKIERFSILLTQSNALKSALYMGAVVRFRLFSFLLLNHELPDLRNRKQLQIVVHYTF